MHLLLEKPVISMTYHLKSYLYFQLYLNSMKSEVVLLLISK